MKAVSVRGAYPAELAPVGSHAADAQPVLPRSVRFAGKTDGDDHLGVAGHRLDRHQGARELVAREVSADEPLDRLGHVRADAGTSAARQIAPVKLDDRREVGLADVL